ncbi:MAG: type II toxin-antitoxin system VapC family toxin [Polaromonas sp.]|nr:type II toxin-antitoxin system VapC family toxin [Polaromonas sp.]
MMPRAYIDTSAFIKRFVEEPGTTEIESFIAEEHYTSVLSSLSIVEIKSVLKRKVISREVTQETAKSIKELIELEIASQSIAFHNVDAATFERTGHLIEGLTTQLGALDAIHLASAKTANCELMVSADRLLIRAATELGLQTLDLS